MVDVVLNTTDLPYEAATPHPAAPAHGEQCTEWGPAHHAIFQMANVCFLISFLMPHNFKLHELCLRGTLVFACMFLGMWGSFVVCHIDVLSWYYTFMVINIGHVCYISYTLYPAKIDPELLDLYTKVFKPLKVSRFQFKEFMAISKTDSVAKDTDYATEGQSHAGEKVSILISGKMKVLYDGQFLHNINVNQFVDSTEYEACASLPSDEKPATMDELFQVTINAMADCRVLSFMAKDLKHFLKSHEFTSAVFTNLIGKDITHKLFQIQDLVLSNAEYRVKQAPKSRSSIVHTRHRLGSLSGPSGRGPSLDSLHGSHDHGHHPLASSPTHGNAPGQNAAEDHV